MRILFVITGLGAGGAERMLLKVAQRLAVRHEMTVISLSGREPLGTEFERAGASVKALGMNGFLSAPRAIAALASEIRSWRPDVVSTWMYHADLLGGLAARWAGVSAIAWCIQNSDLSPTHSRRSTRAIVRLNAQLSHRLPRAIACCSEVSSRIHARLGYDPQRFVLIPNAFDLDQYRPDPAAASSVRAELSIPQSAPLIGLIARWNPQKNHRGFVEAAAILGRRMPEAHFLLSGSGIDDRNAELKRWLSQAGIISVVRLLGLRNDIPRLTAALDLATLSSAYGEAFPNVLGEAMACGVPCVATEVGDCAHIIADTGRVVPVGDPVALANAWEELLRMSPETRAQLGRAARERVSQHFEIGSAARRYEEMFASLASGGFWSQPCAG